MTDSLPPNPNGRSSYRHASRAQAPHQKQPSNQPGWGLALFIGAAIALFLFIAVIMVLIGMRILPGTEVYQSLTGGEHNPSLVVTPTTIPIDTTGAVRIGTPADMAFLRITITDVYPRTEVGGLTERLPDHQYWVVEVTLENTSTDRVVQIEPFGSWMQSASGDRYGVYREPALNTGVPPLRGPLRPGATVRDTLVYEVPQGSSALFWIYRDMTSGERLIFKVT